MTRELGHNTAGVYVEGWRVLFDAPTLAIEDETGAVIFTTDEWNPNRADPLGDALAWAAAIASPGSGLTVDADDDPEFAAGVEYVRAHCPPLFADMCAMLAEDAESVHLDTAPDDATPAPCGADLGDRSADPADITCERCAELAERLEAIRHGYPDPITGEAFTSAQRQCWIETGTIPDVADTFPVSDPTS